MSRTKIKTRGLRDYPKVYRDALACFEAFRRLGFSAEEIFFGFGPVSGQRDIVHMQLQTQGKEFTVMVGQLPGAGRAKVIRAWDAITRLTNSLPPGDEGYLEHVWRQSLFGDSTTYFAVFATGIQEKGIIIPELVPFTAAGQA